MKKALIIILALALALPMAACGRGGSSGGGYNSGNNTQSGNNSTPASPANSQPGKTPGDAFTSPDLSAALDGSYKLSDADAAMRQAFIEEARRAGGDLEFRADGSVVYTDPDGNSLTQNPDGTWEITDKDGSTTSVQYGGNWPENEFTRLVPKPDFDFLAAVQTDNEYVVAFVNPTIDEIKDYVEKVKAAGFTVGADTTDMNIAGLAAYTYTAKNRDGYEVTVASITGASSLTISKP